MLDKIKRIKELVTLLSAASYAYYGKDNPIMSDKQYDNLYDELLELEKETGFILSGSPTQKVQGYIIDSLKKVKHSKPMLSANKTKDIQEIKKFIGDKPCVMSWKEDGLTIVLRYKDGVFSQAITRGQGDYGEDVTHTMKMCKNIPMKIPYCADIEVRGECVISWDDFNRINDELVTPYKHPRNLAAGSVRQLDSNIAKQRSISYKAFELVQDEIYSESKTHPILTEQLMNISESFDYLEECGFDVVEHEYVTKDNVEEIIKKYIPENYKLPVDGLIFEYDDYVYGKNLGETSHHPLNIMALKWADDLYETQLTDIEWTTSRTGLINPVAVFEPVDLDGAITTRATLHNVSYIEDLQLGIGDTIQVYRSNMVIPKVHDNLTRSNTWKLPNKCSCCGSDVEVHNDNGSKTLHCCNPDCKAKLIAKLTHAASKNALNIDGLSEATIEKFVNLGWIKSIKDIYHLENYKEMISDLEGFGRKSIEKLLKAIENSRYTDLSKFLYALSIPLIGKSASKDIARTCEYNIDIFRMTINLEQTNAFKNIEGFGDEMNKSLVVWWNKNKYDFCELVQELSFAIPNDNNLSVNLFGKTFCITGTLSHYSNRNELIDVIERFGGKVVGSVSAKTDYLINNNKESESAKNKKARQLNISIISEEDFIGMIS